MQCLAANLSRSPEYREGEPLLEGAHFCFRCRDAGTASFAIVQMEFRVSTVDQEDIVVDQVAQFWMYVISVGNLERVDETHLEEDPET